MARKLAGIKNYYISENIEGKEKTLEAAYKLSNYFFMYVKLEVYIKASNVRITVVALPIIDTLQSQ